MSSSHNRRETSALPEGLSLPIYPGLIIGLALFTAIIAYQGIVEVAVALAGAGWLLLAVALYHVVPMFADTLAWRSLLSSEGRPSLSHLLWAEQQQVIHVAEIAFDAQAVFQMR